MHQATLDKALAQILKDACYTYKIKGHHIIISPPSKKDDPVEQTQKPVQTIRGTVIDSKTNSPVEYATVSILNAPVFGAISDSLGEFTIIVIRPDVKKAEGIWSNQY